MCGSPPKPPAPAPPEPVARPEIELGNTNPAEDTRQRKRRGRNQLRTGLAIPGGGTGLSIPS